MTENILVGTASWTDKTLLACGRFHPPEANTPQARLRFYASQFPMAEIDPERVARTIDLEARLGVVHTAVDGPQGFANSVPPIWEVTNPALGLVRLHGRNAAAWNTKAEAASSRFDHWYSEAEIEELVPPVRKPATEAAAVHVVFNTNFEDQGQVNAKLMMQALRRARSG